MNYKEIYEKLQKIKANINKVIIGKSNEIDYILTAFVAGGHVLLEDTPGTGKTVMAKSVAKSFGGSFSRIQFTPDLLPADVTGLNIYNQKSESFQFIKGPAFTNILLADEINRATPRTQSSLLECMEEKQISVDGTTYRLQEPFFVIATQNPIETAGTFPLPEAQLDRFMIQLSLGLPTIEEEIAIASRMLSNSPLEKLEPVCQVKELLEMRKTAQTVYVHPDLMKYIVELVQATRNHHMVESGVSPRGTIAFLRACQVYAILHERDFITPEDVKDLFIPVCGHRTLFHAGVTKKEEFNILTDILSSIHVPSEDWKEK